MMYDKEEYQKKIIGLNMNKNKKVFLIASFAFFVICVVIGFILKNDMYFNFVLAIGLSIGFYFYVKSLILSSAKKVNMVSDIISVEQSIYEDRIVEIVKKKDGLENVGEYYYRDISFVKEDKVNLYLYLNPNSAIIVDKSKLEDLDGFINLLKQNDIM